MDVQSAFHQHTRRLTDDYATDSLPHIVTKSHHSSISGSIKQLTHKFLSGRHAIDWVLRRTMDNSTGGITWTVDETLCDLDFADIALIDDSWNSMQQTTSTLTKEANKVGLYINVDKCKLMTTVFGTTDRTYRLQVQK